MRSKGKAGRATRERKERYEKMEDYAKIEQVSWLRLFAFTRVGSISGSIEDRFPQKQGKALSKQIDRWTVELQRLTAA